MTDRRDLLTHVAPTKDGLEAESLQRRCAEIVLEQASAAVRRGVARWAADSSFDGEVGMEAVAAMLALREFDEPLRRRICLHPTFRYWLQAMRRTSRGDDPVNELEFVRSLTGFVWAEQAVAGTLSRSWTVWTDSRGGLRCPTRTRFLELGPGCSHQAVRVEPTTAGVALCTEEGKRVEVPVGDLCEPGSGQQGSIERDGYAVSHAPSVAGGRIEVWSREPWLRVAYTGTNQRTTGVRFFGTREDLYPANIPVDSYAESLRLLNQTWPEQYEDLVRFTHVIVPMLPEPDVHRAFTVSSRQGAVFVDAIDPEAMVDNLIHENAHIKLRQLQLVDSLLIDPFDEAQRFPVPWRPDPRPIPGIFEGLWVFAHVAEYRWRRIGSAEGPERFASLVKDLTAGHAILSSCARLTDGGQQFFTAMTAWLESLQLRAASLTPAASTV